MFASAWGRVEGRGEEGGGWGYVGLNSKQCRLWKTAGCAEVYTREHIMDGRATGWLAG